MRWPVQEVGDGGLVGAYEGGVVVQKRWGTHCYRVEDRGVDPGAIVRDRARIVGECVVWMHV